MTHKPTDNLIERINDAIENIKTRQCWIDCKCLNCLADSLIIQVLTDCRKEIEKLEIEVSRLESLADNYERGLGR